MEVQFIKVNVFSRPALDEEIGKLPREIPGQLVIGVGSGSKDELDLDALRAPVKRRSSLTTLTWSLAKDYGDLGQTRALGRALDVRLTLHAPYYVDFFGSEEARERSLRQIQWAGLLADALGSPLTITHLGFYGGGSRPDSIQELTNVARDLQAWLTVLSRGAVRLGVEPSGHPDVFGSREEVLELAHQVNGIVPILNLPHLAARERTNFDDPVQLKQLIDQFVQASKGDLYLNFSGVEFYGPTEFRLTPIKRGIVRFDPLAEILAERDYAVTVISSSPLLEHDGMYLKLLYERALSRRWAKKHAPAPPKPVGGAATAKAAPRPMARPPPAPARRPTPRPPPRAHPRAARPISHARSPSAR
jgi:deoxyribonuclease-4